MPRLVVNPGSPAAWEIQLKPGVNFIGRGFANDFKIADSSVSTSHCQIVVGDQSIVLKDLGSTNGTFVNRAPVSEAALETGQTIHLGTVEMLFEADAPASMPAIAQIQIPPPPVPVPTRSQAAAPVLATPPITPMATAEPQQCKFHPKTPGRFLCHQCQQSYCELCVASRHVKGAQRKFCRHCGAECVPIQIQARRAVQKGFFSHVPAAFLYPFRGAGILVVIVGMVIFGLLKVGTIAMRFGSIRLFIFGIILQIVAGGYLFTYLQTIVHATAAEDKELPDLPGLSNFLDDIVMPFFRLLGLMLFCFGPAIVLAIWAATSHQTALSLAFLAALIFGYLYFPMAFLSVAILDSVAAANPLVVVPSILKVPLEYLFTIFLLASVFGFLALGNVLIRIIFPEGWLTHSVPELFAMVGALVLHGFMTLYMLIVTVHILGLLYVARKDRLAWLDR
jgi:hypothetical protein